MKKLLVAILASCISLTGLAIDYHVAPTDASPAGSDSNPGTAEAPFATIAKAITTANAAIEGGESGATIHLADGTYTEYNLTLAKAITVKSLSGNRDSVIVQANTSARGTTGRRVFFISSDDAVVADITIRYGCWTTKGSGTDNGYNGGNIRMSAGMVTNCVVAQGHVIHTMDASIKGALGGNIYMVGGTVVDCDILDGSIYNVNGAGGGANVMMHNGGRIVRCRISGGCRSSGASTTYTLESGGSGLYMNGACTAENSLICNNSGAYGSVALIGAARLVNCTIAGNSGNHNGYNGVILRDANPLVVNCVMFGNGGTAINEWGNSQPSRFLYCAAPNAPSGTGCFALAGLQAEHFEDDEYRPLPTSSMIDAGASDLYATYAISPTDLDGNARAIGDGTDVGCYEPAISLVITGMPFEAGIVSPSYGIIIGLAKSEVVNCTATSGVSADGRYSAICNGYVLYACTNGIETEITRGTGATCDYTHPGFICKLVWQWSDVKVRVAASAGEGGHVAVSPPSGTGHYATNSTVTITATADAGKGFYKWTGDVPEALRWDNPLVLKLSDKPVSVHAIFADALYVAPDGIDAADRGFMPDTPLATPQVAIDRAGPVGIVYLAEGTFAVDAFEGNYLAVTNAVKVRGAGRDRTIISFANSPKARAVYLNDPEALVSGVTFCDSSTKSISDCAGQIGVRGGELTDSRVTGYLMSGWISTVFNMSTGAVRRCVFDSCRSETSDLNPLSMPYAGLIEDCLVVSNTANSGCAGVRIGGGLMRNCTIAHNYTRGSRAGVYRLKKWTGHTPWGWRNDIISRVENCVIVGNRAPNDVGAGWPDWYDQDPAAAAPHVTHCASLQPWGANPVTNNIHFVAPGNFRTLAGSLCIDGGKPSADTDRKDLDGNPRPAGRAIDIGCYEYDASAPSCGATVVPECAFTGAAVQLAAQVHGFPGEAALECSWILTPAQGGAPIPLSGLAPSVSPVPCGFYTIDLTVTDGTHTATSSRTNALFVAARTNYVAVVGASSPVYPYDTPATAATNVFDVVDHIIDGSTVIFLDGEHILERQLSITNAVTYTSLNGMDSTTLRLSPANTYDRVVLIDQTNAVVRGVTITGGQVTSGTTWAIVGVGVKIACHGGTLERCRVTGNKLTGANTASGVYLNSNWGRVTHCEIVGNGIGATGSTGAGGIYMTGGTLDNSLIAANVGNSGSASGALSMEGAAKVYNCTIAFNTNMNSTTAAGVLINSKSAYRFQNNIVAHNVAPKATALGGAEWRQANNTAEGNQAATNGISNNCFGTAPAWGANAICVVPEFIDPANGDAHLLASSPCIDSGMEIAALAHIADDLDGNDRVMGAAIDLGCYEYDTSGFACGFAAESEICITGSKVRFTGSATGLAEGETVEFFWTFTGSDGTVIQAEGAIVEPTFTAPGTYDVALLARRANLETASYVRAGCLLVAPGVTYVVVPAGDANPAYPYDTWEKAATNIFDVLPHLVDGCRVNFGAGIHRLPRELILDRAVELVGVAGRDATILALATNAPESRVLTVDCGATVRGFSVTGSRFPSSWTSAGAVYITGTGGLLADCAVTGNVRRTGVQVVSGVKMDSAFGRMERCLVTDNFSSQSRAGGELNAGFVKDCIFARNGTANGPGGVSLGGGVSLINCTIADNYATSGGVGGLYYGSNAARVTNCVVSGNVLWQSEGDPIASEYSFNLQSWEYAAARERVVHNCFGAGDPPSSDYTSDNIAGDPQFDPKKGDYRLLTTSPCHNTGIYHAPWHEGQKDVYGHARVDRKLLVDLGAVERPYAPPATTLVLR